MPTWDEILDEVQGEEAPDRFAIVRRKYARKLHEITNRNVICYYSAFLTQSVYENLGIDDGDMSGFMTTIKGLDKALGLDLILHTPGGSPTAAEAIITYLRSVFGTDIRIIVPHLAMSAGTMMACAGKEIVMGKQSSLGPIDPQLGSIPAFNIKRLFDDAKDDIASNPQSANYWSLLLGSIPPATIYDCINAI
ncbi:MAG: ATP-dependent Clp protease proteolytic subunit, partial [Clostridiales Family XIII bacterium]|nr:ATP-dependent Clp protease proteolytic subunit [Clostridiales Family XIII bacterium]